jgi:hypothetical protein
MIRRIYVFTMLASISMISIGLLGCSARLEPIQVADIDVGDLSALSSESENGHSFTLSITNPNSTRVRILGLIYGCNNGFCIRYPDDTSFEIPAKSTISVKGDIKASPGPFEGEFVVYYDDGHIREVPYKIRGRGVPSP